MNCQLQSNYSIFSFITNLKNQTTLKIKSKKYKNKQQKNTLYITQSILQQFYQPKRKMNPQNMGPHIDLHHSSLWRKSMWTPHDVQRSSSCHKQLNQLGQTGQSWKTRDNMIQTNYSSLGRSSLPKSSRSRLLSETLYHDKKQTPATRSFIQSIQKQASVLDRNPKLVEGMSKLKEMNLLTSKELHQVKFPGIIRHQHIYNDYHQRSANPGFSRNVQGKFFTK